MISAPLMSQMFLSLLWWKLSTVKSLPIRCIRQACLVKATGCEVDYPLVSWPGLNEEKSARASRCDDPSEHQWRREYVSDFFSQMDLSLTTSKLLLLLICSFLFSLSSFQANPVFYQVLAQIWQDIFSRIAPCSGIFCPAVASS